MSKEITIFDYLNAINYKSDISYNKKIAPAFMLSMWLAHDPAVIHIVNRINEYQFKLADSLVFQYYMGKIPKGKRFLKWSKKEAADKKADKELKKVYEDLNERYHISKAEFEKYKKLITKGYVVDKPKKSDNLVDEFFKE